MWGNKPREVKKPVQGHTAKGCKVRTRMCLILLLFAWLLIFGESVGSDFPAEAKLLWVSGWRPVHLTHGVEASLHSGCKMTVGEPPAQSRLVLSASPVTAGASVHFQLLPPKSAKYFLWTTAHGNEAGSPTPLWALWNHNEEFPGSQSDRSNNLTTGCKRPLHSNSSLPPTWNEVEAFHNFNRNKGVEWSSPWNLNLAVRVQCEHP